MKLFRKLAVFALCGVFALAIAGCQSQKQEAPERDTDLQVSDAPAAETFTGPFWVLVVGNDSRIGTTQIDNPNYSDGTGRSDTIMLMRIDPKTYNVGIITVARDTATEYNGQTVKLNETYRQGGIAELSKQVQKLTGATPKYTFDMDFVQFEKFVDGLGGVTANVPINMQLKDIVAGDKISLSAGERNLNGAEALVLARSRKQYANDLDACRQIQDRQIVQRAIEQVAADPANAAAHVNTLVGNCDTDWPLDSLVALVADFAQNADKITFTSGTGPYDGNQDTGLWLATRDEATWAQVIDTVEAGGDPTTIVPLPQVVALEG